MITAVIIDSREPQDIQSLKFGGIPISIASLDRGDLMAVTDDGAMLLVERKTPNDLLSTLREERLFPQIARLTEKRLEEQCATGRLVTWPYLVITGPLTCSPEGKVIADNRLTGWDWRSVWGALLSIQEMGAFVVFAQSDADYEACILRLGQRSRDPEFKVLPPRPAKMLGAQAEILASLPGIGIDRVLPILRHCGSVGEALEGLTGDQEIPGVGDGMKRKIRQALGLVNGNWLAIVGPREEGQQ